MGDECKYCKKWKERCKKFEEHFYWSHVDARKMHFSKSMTGDFSKCLIIPKKFIEHFTGELLETVELKVPSGDIWHVELKKTKAGVVLDCGWKDFVEAHGIQENDTLMFNYNGGSSFLVLMFEDSGCEKAASHCPKKRDPMDTLCATPYGKMPRRSCNMSSSRNSDDELPLAVHREISRTSRRAKENHVQQRKNPKRAYRRKKLIVHSRQKNAAKEQESSTLEGMENPEKDVSLVKQSTSNIFFISKKPGIKAAENIELRSFAETIKTDKPCFAITMVSCSTIKRFYMSIPIAFATQYLPRTTNEIILQLPDKERHWDVQCYVQAHSVALSRGWREFVHDNGLKIGDICLFELEETLKHIVLTVHIKKVEITST
ncbi:B3 domain-containing protein [Platanthera guangdongensis]|uniref:B3 domain-containing protein n=1 Tax=Platanthera guangdongensis TaxID=2320717 RepID=A0ABR2MIX5_9ASPA